MDFLVINGSLMGVKLMTYEYCYYL